MAILVRGQAVMVELGQPAGFMWINSWAVVPLTEATSGHLGIWKMGSGCHGMYSLTNWWELT